ncbi:hypothetical protein [Streptomyces sp. WAC06614]|uniref:hypothetical protein n=1 Tax=Streptomyces sp. WAC06614 TaxID=2487416 RepID=UPI000F7AFF20|nr:hypothetical protein [Streptomyces sp. WAC06614]RSS79572.1 hypothetical protein EF918_16805 [Streptomyces sp. WAC06614]
MHFKKKTGAIVAAASIAGLLAASAPADAADERPTRGIRIKNSTGVALTVVSSGGGAAMWATGQGPDDTPELLPGQTTNWEALLYGQGDGTVILEDWTHALHLQVRVIVGMINQSLLCDGSTQPRGEDFRCKGEGWYTDGTLELVKM